VAVLDAADDLLEEVPRLVLQQPPLLHDVIEQFASLPCAIRGWVLGPKMPSEMGHSRMASTQHTGTPLALMLMPTLIAAVERRVPHMHHGENYLQNPAR
jgi:predicted permease